LPPIVPWFTPPTSCARSQGKEVPRRLDHGFQPVRLPDYPDIPLWLVVVRGLAAAPTMLLTTLPMRKKRSLP